MQINSADCRLVMKPRQLNGMRRLMERGGVCGLGIQKEEDEETEEEDEEERVEGRENLERVEKDGIAPSFGDRGGERFDPQRGLLNTPCATRFSWSMWDVRVDTVPAQWLIGLSFGTGRGISRRMNKTLNRLQATATSTTAFHQKSHRLLCSSLAPCTLGFRGRKTPVLWPHRLLRRSKGPASECGR